MTEREKMIEVIAPYVSAYGDDEAIADALIEAGIGDVTEYQSEAEYWKTICKFESDEYYTKIKNAAEHARHLMQERDEYKHRAEVAEMALNKACADMEAVRKQTVQEFAERVKMAFHYEFDELIPSIMAEYFTGSRARN